MSGRRLGRPVVVRTALRCIDRFGPQGLTMRAVGDELGVEGMALYRYVTGREALLDAVAELLLQEVIDRLDERGPTTWRGYLQSLAHATRDVALEHPRAFPLVATRRLAAPWLRPPLSSLKVVEQFLRALGRFRLTDDQRVDAYRAFSSFLLGSVLVEVAAHVPEASPGRRPLDGANEQVPDLDQHIDVPADSEVSRLWSKLSEDRGPDEFETALEMVLDRLELKLLT